ncbi:alpha/beta family hydrolase [Lacimicrobium alkaliphilum]|uniref:Alpha/beta hydrolase n=1 Tax=Lacimicrobium alkaliphilum TaxID=1526571 RepID=A0ABQ1RDK5_9ALTE|nr:alpha/beta family hydrolase [Lacimicrobium alkaliphilum]GGD63651.1 alpha/beta hydrolase [Lacimicrobium alkaliphilum]
MLLTNKAESPIASVLLAHGAGAGMHSEFMQQIAEQLCRQGVTVHRFNFAYMQRSETQGKRRPPERVPKLTIEFVEAIAEAGHDLPLFIGGKSMGGRVASMLCEHEHIKGCLCYGYPFHPPGKPEKLRTEHLLEDGKPVLILQGERDPFGTRVESERYPLHSRVKRVYVPDGEHSFKPRKASGISLQQNMDFAVQQSINFIQEQL